jgi:S1-C subfamily serine protease/regulator of sirC expression with transglutaminase-like and TPR domain
MRSQLVPLVFAVFLCSCAALLAAEAPEKPDKPAEAAKTIPLPATPLPASVEELVKQARPAVVVITIAGRDGGQQGLGTGFIISPDGLIATNLHVIGEARPISVQTAEGKSLAVQSVYASDRTADLAILKVAAKDLPALEIADKADLAQGQPIVVLGNPQGLKHSVVSGVLSGLREMNDRQMIQLALPIEPGNSGGPVLDAAGRVLGIVTMKSLVTENLGFAVLASDLKPLLDKPNTVPIERWLTIGTLDPDEWQPLFGAHWHQRSGHILVDGLGQGFGGRSLCLLQETPPKLPFEVAVSVKLGDEKGAAGLAFQADGKDRHYGFYPSNGRLRLTRFDGPDVFSWKVLDEQSSVAYKPGEWNELKVRLEKDKLTCYVNGQLVMTSTDSELGGGKVGLAKFRETSAEFKRLRVGKQLASDIPVDEDAAPLLAAIEQLPGFGAVQSDDLATLVAARADSAALLRQQAAKLRARADDLQKLADDVHTHKVVAELALLVDPQVKQVDLLRAALTLARLDEEDVDVEAYVRQVDRMAAEIRQLLPKEEQETDDAARLAALNKYLFAENGFHGSRSDYYNRANSYLNRVIDDREGLPITLAVLYMELGRRIGLDIEGVGLPGHFVVRQQPAKGEPQLIDVFEGGLAMSRAAAGKKVREMTDRPLAPEDLAAVDERMILLRMLQNLLGVAQNKPDREAMLRYLEAIVAIDPTLARERGLRAIVRFESGRREAAITDLDWFLTTAPEGIDLDQIRNMQEYFRSGRR